MIAALSKFGASAVLWVLPRLSPAVLACVMALGFYHGVPVVKEIPFLRYVPLVGPSLDWIATGEIGRRERAASAAEKRRWEDEIEELQRRVAAERFAKTEAINEITREYLLSGVQNAIAVGALQEIVNDLENRPEDRVCGNVPAVSKRLSIGLDAVGRKGTVPGRNSAAPAQGSVR